MTSGRFGLRRATDTKWGMMRLTTTGRRSGEPRSVILGYFDDGPNLVTLAMNGWDPAEPAWWLNLQDHPRATVQTALGERSIVGRAAHGEERERLWERWRTYDGDDIDALAERRPKPTAVVVLEPASNASG